METYVQGMLDVKLRSEARQLRQEIEPLGYEFTADGMGFAKSGRVESVINELMPICDSLGMDVDDLRLSEYRKGDGSLRSSFAQGEIDRD